MKSAPGASLAWTQLQAASTTLECLNSNSTDRWLTVELTRSPASTPERLTRALGGDRFLRGRLFELPAQQLLAVLLGGGPSGMRWQMIGFGLLQGLRGVSGLRDRDYLLYLRTMRSHMAVARLPYPENLSRARQVAKSARDYRGLPPYGGLPLDLTGQLVPELWSLLILEAEKDARLRTMQTGLAVERYRLENHGTLPNRLSDPCRRTSREFPRIHSTESRCATNAAHWLHGLQYRRDQNDDGGQETVKSGKGPRDLTFTVER